MLYPYPYICYVSFPSGIDAKILVGHNATITLMCADPGGLLPSWFMDGLLVSGDRYSSSTDENTGMVIGTLRINGSDTIGSFNVHCSSSIDGQVLHNLSLAVGG